MIAVLCYIVVPIGIPPLCSTRFLMQYLDPESRRPVAAVRMIAPVHGEDYIVLGEDGESAAETTCVSVEFLGQTAVCSVRNGAEAIVYLTKFQLRGQPLPEAPECLSFLHGRRPVESYPRSGG